MEQNRNGHVVKMYKNQSTLNKQHVKLIMHDAAHLGFEKFGLKLGQRANVTILASATMCLFPREFPAISMLVPSKGRNSPFYNAALNRVRLEQNKLKESGGSVKAEGESSNNEEDMTIEEHLVFLTSAHKAQKEAIEHSLKRTWDHRKHLLATPDYDIQTLIFNFFLCEVHYIHFEFSLLLKDKEISLENPINEMTNSITFDVLKRIQPSLNRLNVEVPDEVKAYYGLIKLLGYSSGRHKNDNFASTCSHLAEFVQSNTPNQQIIDTTTNTQPFIVCKYDTDSNIVSQYLIVFHPHVIPLKPNSTFVNSLDILFKLYHIFDIIYPASLVKFFKFLEEFFYAMNKHDIPSNTQIFHKIMTINRKLIEDEQTENSGSVEIIDIEDETENNGPSENNGESSEFNGETIESEDEENIIITDNMEISAYEDIQEAE